MKALTMLALLMLTQVVQAFYDPSIGRWLNRDPLSDSSNIHIHAADSEVDENDINLSPYEFIANNPIEDIDAFGLARQRNQNTPGNCNRGQLRNCRKICEDQGKSVKRCDISWIRQVIYREELPNGWRLHYRDFQRMRCECEDPPVEDDRCPIPPPPNLRRNRPPDFPDMPPPFWIPPARWFYGYN